MSVEKNLLEAINNINDKQKVIDLLGGVTVELAKRDDDFAKLMLARVKARKLDIMHSSKKKDELVDDIRDMLEDAKHARL